MATPLNSTKAAELIQRQTGRQCSRQNLDKLCSRGALRDSVCILRKKPLQVDGDTLVAEYLSKVPTHQAEAHQPAMKREAPTPSRAVRVVDSDDVPDYNEERARHEREKRMLAELARQEKERELLRRDDVTAAWAAAVAMTRTKLLGVPSVVRARIPHLEIDEVEVITQLIREALEELSAGEVQA